MDATMNETFVYLDMYEDEYSDANCSQGCDESPRVSTEFAAMRTVLCVLCVLGLLGNASVLWILQRYVKLKTLTDVCLLNLALSDLSLALSLLLWAYNSQSLAACKVATGVYQLGFYSGTLLVTLLSADRYLAIVHAVAVTRTRTLGYGPAAGVAVWLVSVVMATPEVTFASVVADDDSSLSCKPLYPDQSQQFWKMFRNFREHTVSLFVCLPIQIFCYVKILLVVSKTRNSKKARAVKLILTVVGVFVVCWVPYNVVVFLQTLQLFAMLGSRKASRAIDSATTWSEIIAVSHCCVNPVIYALVGEKFREPLGNLLPRYCSKRRSSVNSETETSNTALRSQ
ncbi:C-C chemokine receptor type 8 [Syngnathoides biaculeatus]|uniref:C-C chemokine receptor type 8 n=1 Tax=Syngnathoides biaculeatus TaxID=300417 RepID=UPI002ADD7A01|nr:C-C chemokine receptor type 8 [Syngnathoides biaculeatus]